MNFDLVNGLFELAGSIAIWANVVRLYKDKEVKGTRWEMMIFFAAWASFNLFYYPNIGQWWSLVGALSMCIAEWFWVVLAFWYSRAIFSTPETRSMARVAEKYNAEQLRNPYSRENIFYFHKRLRAAEEPCTKS